MPCFNRWYLLKEVRAPAGAGSWFSSCETCGGPWSRAGLQFPPSLPSFLKAYKHLALTSGSCRERLGWWHKVTSSSCPLRGQGPRGPVRRDSESGWGWDPYWGSVSPSAHLGQEGGRVRPQQVTTLQLLKVHDKGERFGAALEEITLVEASCCSKVPSTPPLTLSHLPPPPKYQPSLPPVCLA